MKTDNELIADFDGWVFCDDDGVNYPYGYYLLETDHEKSWCDPREFKYAESWDWLMPVVEKIGKLYEKAFPSNEEFIKRIMAHNDPIDKEYVDVISISVCTPISEVYEATVKFIKWYNKTPHP